MSIFVEAWSEVSEPRRRLYETMRRQVESRLGAPGFKREVRAENPYVEMLIDVNGHALETLNALVERSSVAFFEEGEDAGTR